MALLVAAAVLPLVTAPLLLLANDRWVLHVLGWLIATFGTAALLIAFTLVDTGRRASAWYLGRESTVRALRTAAIVLALLAAAAQSYQFADWFARLGTFA